MTATALETLGTIVTFWVTQSTAILTFMVANPLLLVFAGLAVAGGAVGLLSRAFHAI